jgi:mRNA-degrading endonuclease RelE of RelBE toxin-antitoxin system
MTNTVSVSIAFKREAKRLIKKYATLQASINNLILELTNNPLAGDAYGDDIYKVRLADKSKGKGKSGGFRVMYYHLNKTSNGIDILMMSIYDKSEKATIKKTDAIKKLKEILSEHLSKG